MCLRWVLSRYNCSDARYFSVSGAEMTREVKWKEVLLNAENLRHLFTRFYCCLLCKEGAIKVMCNVLLMLLFHFFRCSLASWSCHICNSWERQFYWQKFWFTIMNMSPHQNTHVKTHEKFWNAVWSCHLFPYVRIDAEKSSKKGLKSVWGGSELNASLSVMNWSWKAKTC